MTPANEQTGTRALIEHFRNRTQPTDDQFAALVEDIAQNGPTELKEVLAKMIEDELMTTKNGRQSQ